MAIPNFIFEKYFTKLLKDVDYFPGLLCVTLKCSRDKTVEKAMQKRTCTCTIKLSIASKRCYISCPAHTTKCTWFMYRLKSNISVCQFV